MSVILSNLSNLARFREDRKTAQNLSQESLAICHQNDDRWNAAMALDNLGELALAQKDYVAAERFCQEALIIGQELNMSYFVVVAHCHLGQAACGQGNYTAARNYLREGLSLTVEIRAIPHVLEAQFSANVFERAQVRGKTKALDVVVAEILAEI